MYVRFSLYITNQNRYLYNSVTYSSALHVLWTVTFKVWQLSQKSDDITYIPENMWWLFLTKWLIVLLPGNLFYSITIHSSLSRVYLFFSTISLLKHLTVYSHACDNIIFWILNVWHNQQIDVRKIKIVFLSQKVPTNCIFVVYIGLIPH